ELAELGLRIEPQEARSAAEYAGGVPDRAVGRVRHHRIGTGARIVARVLALLRLVAELVELAVAVGVEHEREPARRLLGIAGLVEHLGVDPAGDLTGAGPPQRVVGVITELRMVRAKAGVDELVFLGLEIEHGRLARALIERGY